MTSGTCLMTFGKRPKTTFSKQGAVYGAGPSPQADHFDWSEVRPLPGRLFQGGTSRGDGKVTGNHKTEVCRRNKHFWSQHDLALQRLLA